jgi:DnaJ-class molecular chaperone
MKRLAEVNYYDLLDISPKASFEEVQAAYDEAMAAYASDSIVTYSLFTKQEREQVVARLLEAYKTLTNTHLRREYNELLIKKGELSPDETQGLASKGTGMPETRLREVTVESIAHEKEFSGAGETPADNLELFAAHTYITGSSIRMVRTNREMSLEEVYRKTNIPKQTLEDIEEDNFERLPALVYLKGFLKVYAQALMVDQALMVNGYVKRYLEWKTTGQK